MCIRDRNQQRRIRLILAKTGDTLQNSRLFEEKQRGNAALEPLQVKLGSGEMGRQYLLDEDILWYASKGEEPKLAVARVMISGVLALVQSTFGHPGVAWTNMFVQASTAGRR